MSWEQKTLTKSERIIVFVVSVILVILGTMLIVNLIGKGWLQNDINSFSNNIGFTCGI